MRIRALTLWLVLIASFSSFATTFIRQDIQKQLSDSTAVVYGKYVGQIARRLPNGNIVTEVSIELVESVGVDERFQRNPREFKAIYPGGEWLGVVHYVTGTPRFKIGEEVVLLLKQNSQGFWVNNLALGKYNVLSKNNDKFISSSVFPNDSNLGNIDFEKFKKMVQKRFKKGLQRSGKLNTSIGLLDKADSGTTKMDRGDQPADYSEKPAFSGGSLSTGADSSSWLIVVLLLLGLVVFVWLKNR